MSQFYTYPPSVAGNNASVGSNGATAPTSSTEVAGVNPSGQLQPLQTNAAGSLITTPDPASQQHVIVDSSALPAGASTSALQTAGNSSLSTIATNTTGVSTAANQTTANSSLASIDGKTPNLGQATTAGSVPVVLPASQITALTPPSTVTVIQPTAANLNATVTGSVAVTNFPASQPVSGTVTVVQPTGTNLHTVIDSSTLPTGASTSALQTNANASLTTIAANQTNGTQVTTISGTVPVSGSVIVTQATAANLNATVVVSNTPNVAVTSSVLPTGAATSALQTQISGQLPATLGAKTTANSLSVNIASDQVVATKSGGRSLANSPTVTTYATPVTSSAYVQIIASTSLAASLVELFDSSGVSIYLAVGAAGSEVNQLVIYPGGNGQVAITIPVGSRISYKAVSASATGSTAYNVLNLYT